MSQEQLRDFNDLLDDIYLQTGRQATPKEIAIALQLTVMPQNFDVPQHFESPFVVTQQERRVYRSLNMYI